MKAKPIRFRTAVVVANPKKAWAVKLAHDVTALLKSKGINISNSRHAGLLITISGDGTILYNKDRYDTPIFAIGSRNSYICQATQADWKPKLLRILSGRFSVERRMMLACSTGSFRRTALNEIVVHSRDHRVIGIHLSVGKRHYSFLADGVIFSTPTGSTAYAYSAGGRELPPHSPYYEVVAVAPYRRKFKPMLVPKGTRIAVSTTSPNADLVFDGQFIRPVSPSSRISIFASRREAKFLKLRHPEKL